VATIDADSSSRASSTGWPERITSWRSTQRSTRRGITGWIVLLVMWEIIGRFVITSKLFFVPFSDVLAAFSNLLATGELQQHFVVSGQEFLQGYFMAAIAGTVMGFVMAHSRLLREYLEPLLSALYSTPMIALTPLFILWFGIGMASKIAVVFLMVIFPVWINTSVGFVSTDRSYLEVARSFGASRWQSFVQVVFPSALPFVIAGLRLGVGRGIVAVVVGELFGARAGLGYLIFFSSQAFQTANLFVGILVLALTGMFSMAALQRLERHLAPWRPASLGD